MAQTRKPLNNGELRTASFCAALFRSGITPKVNLGTHRYLAGRLALSEAPAEA